MRDDVMLKLIQRVTEDDGFRQRIGQNLEGALESEGYALTEDEMAAVHEFKSSMASMNDREISQQLAKGQRSHP
jgi:hypothetical protein